MKVFFPFGDPSFEITLNFLPVSLTACSFGFAIVADESITVGFEA